MKLLSIIVPIYNASKYLKTTLQSIAKQTYSNIEVLLIDDGSTDNSAELCLEMVEKDNRFRYYKIKNGGPSKARNLGIKLAMGKYIGFCDSDDLLNNSMYDILVNYLENSNSDVVLCDIYSERNNGNFGFPWKDGTIFSGDDVYRQVMASMIGRLSEDDDTLPVWGSVVRGLYKREIIVKNNISFPDDIHFAEDLVFSLKYLMKAKKIIICNYPLYHYRDNKDSIMNSFYEYKIGMFDDRKKLIKYIQNVICNMKKINEIESRLFNTARCYFHESIGNACRDKKDRTILDKYHEVKMILNDEIVIKSFESYQTKNYQKKVLYLLIRNRIGSLLVIYYYLRFKKWRKKYEK